MNMLLLFRLGNIHTLPVSSPPASENKALRESLLLSRVFSDILIHSGDFTNDLVPSTFLDDMKVNFHRSAQSFYPSTQTLVLTLLDV
jgi:hypothetical protein